MNPGGNAIAYAKHQNTVSGKLAGWVYAIFAFCFLFINLATEGVLLALQAALAFILFLTFRHRPIFTYVTFLMLALFSNLYSGEIYFKTFVERQTDEAMTALANTSGLVALLQVIIKKPKVLQLQFKMLAVDWLLALFLVFLTIGALISEFSEHSLEQLQRFPSFILLYFLTRTLLKSREDFLILIQAFTAMLNCLFLLTISKILINDRFYDQGRFVSILAIVLGYVFYKLRTDRNSLKTMLMFMLSVAISFSMLASSSRRILIGVVVVWFFMLVMSKTKPAYFLGLGISVLLLINMKGLLPNRATERFTTTYAATSRLLSKEKTFTQEDASALFTERDKLWEAGVLMAKDYFLFGVGLGSSKYKIKEYGATSGLRVHNLFLDIWADNGIFALLLFLIIIACLLRYMLKARHIFGKLGDGISYMLATGIFAGIVAEMAMSFFGMAGPYGKFGWFLYGIAGAVYVLSRQRFIFS